MKRINSMKSNLKQAILRLSAAAIIGAGLFINTQVIEAQVEPSAWAKEEFEEAIEKGYITENMMVELQANITREGFVELIVTAYEKMFQEVDGVSVADNPFVDTENLAVIKAAMLGIVSNNTDFFYPEDYITREQVAVMFVRLSEAIEERAELSVFTSEKELSLFSDDEQIALWAKEQVYLAVSNGICNGMNDNRFNPQMNSTKEQAVLMNLRLFNILEENQGLKEYISQYVVLSGSELYVPGKEEETQEISDVVLVTQEAPKEENTTPVEEEVLVDVAFVTTEVLRMRSAPDLNDSSNIIRKLSMDTKVIILGSTGDWYEVKALDGLVGYVHKDYVRVSQESSTQVYPQASTVEVTSASAASIIEYAKQFVGTPYRYGGTSLSKGIDCSSFTQQMFGKFGISLGRSSRDQYKYGVSVSKSELQPGDLLFYGYSGYISHVAIYMGNGLSIHATTTSGVRITDAFGWMSLPYIGARRILNN